MLQFKSMPILLVKAHCLAAISTLLAHIQEKYPGQLFPTM